MWCWSVTAIIIQLNLVHAVQVFCYKFLSIFLKFLFLTSMASSDSQKWQTRFWKPNHIFYNILSSLLLFAPEPYYNELSTILDNHCQRWAHILKSSMIWEQIFITWLPLHSTQIPICQSTWQHRGVYAMWLLKVKESIVPKSDLIFLFTAKASATICFIVVISQLQYLSIQWHNGSSSH